MEARNVFSALAEEKDETGVNKERKKGAGADALTQGGELLFGDSQVRHLDIVFVPKIGSVGEGRVYLGQG